MVSDQERKLASIGGDLLQRRTKRLPFTEGIDRDTKLNISDGF